MSELPQENAQEIPFNPENQLDLQTPTLTFRGWGYSSVIYSICSHECPKNGFHTPGGLELDEECLNTCIKRQN